MSEVSKRGGRGDLPLIDTLFLFAILGLAVPILYKIIQYLSDKTIQQLSNFGYSESGMKEEHRETIEYRVTNFDPIPPAPEEVECQYCGTLYPRDLSKCPNCYAPRKNNR